VIQLSIGQKSDPGPREGENQDSVLVVTPAEHPDTTLLLVADGMGGAKAGEHASQQAVAVIRDWLFGGEALTPDTIPDRLRQAITAANTAIYHKGQNIPEFQGMGCTVVSALVLDDTYWIASVGDSRAYLVRGMKLHQLTTDHTWVNARLQEGLLTPEQAAGHSLAHVLDRALGVDKSVKVDVGAENSLEEGDVVVLCTDGLYGVIDERVIAWAAANHPAHRAADILLERALNAPTHDNVSVIVVRAGDPEPPMTWSLDNGDFV
jgi:serine/threonine protein phosphatase PrpC